MNVPLLDLKAQHDPLYGDIISAIERVIRGQSFILGPEVKQLEELIAGYCHSKHAIGVSSGTDALLIALMALNVGPGDEVITTPYSFFATAGVIARVGARPVFADIDPISYNIDPNKVEQAITSRTKVVMPVHLYGQCAEMASLLQVTGRHNLPVIEDAAQAIGSEYKDGRRAGGMGQLGCFSFFPSKNLGALGDAGMVVTDHAELAEKVRILRVHGGQPKYYHKVIGGNFRLDTLQAAVLCVKFKYLDEWTRKRQANAGHYAKLFNDSGLLGKGLISLPRAVYEAAGVSHYHIYNQFVIRATNRDALRNYLRDQGVGTEVYYPVPLHLQECFRSLGYREGNFPEAERAARETLALPIYPEISSGQQQRVVEVLAEFYAKAGA